MTESPSQRDFTFFKWFSGIATIMVVGFSAFLFNLAISNQTSIREALIEIRNIKMADRTFEERMRNFEDRFDNLAQDPVHGWGQRWSRQEADRENSRQDKKLERLESQLDNLRAVMSEIQIPLSRNEATLQSMKAAMEVHSELPAHTEAGKEILLLSTKVEQLIETLENRHYMHYHSEEDGKNETHR